MLVGIYELMSQQFRNAPTVSLRVSLHRISRSEYDDGLVHHPRSDWDYPPFADAVKT